MNSERESIAKDGRGLRRGLRRVDALAIGVGSVIGTGIFRTTGDVLRGAFFTASKLALVVAVVVLGVVAAAARLGRAPDATSPLAPIPFAGAVAACWYSFMGWQDAALLSEEMRNPTRDIRFVLVATVAIVSTAYLAIHVAIFEGLGANDAAGAFPVLTLARRLLGAGGESAMSVALLVSMFGGAAESLLVRPRVLYALARDGLAPRALAYVSAGGTPAGAMLVHTAIVLALLVTGSFRSLLAIVAFTQALTGLVEASSALVLLDASSSRASTPLVRGLLVVASALLCVVVAWEDPLQMVYAGGAVAVLGALYPLMRRAVPSVSSDAVPTTAER